MKEKEIFSSCCCFGGIVEEVHVLKSECPVQRKEGGRIVPASLSSDEGDREEVTCIYHSFDGIVIPACQHYQGTKKVQRNGRRKYKVLCAALESK